MVLRSFLLLLLLLMFRPISSFLSHRPPTRRMASVSRRYSRQVFIQQNKEIGELANRGDWRGLLDYAEDKSSSFNDVNWATTFSKLGRFGRNANVVRQIVRDARFSPLLSDLEENIGKFDSRALANIVHALGGMGVRSDKIVRFVEDNAERILAKAEPQAMANIAYAFAKLEFKASRYFKALNRENIVDELVNGTPQEIANTIWAMATLGEEAGTLAREINTVETSRKIVKERPQAIVNTIWAMATLGEEAGTLA
ncbi:hypothetical protein TrLO_g3359, partial [Triparma laevis f. longispina]